MIERVSAQELVMETAPEQAGRLRLAEIFGLSPAGEAYREARDALLGKPYRPPTRWGLSSLRILKPWISLPTWLGRKARGDRLWVYNLVNRVPQPKEEAYSVRVTRGRDFMGGRWTYDGHQGTDFAAPVGTVVTSGAPGRVLRVANDFQHGGLKVCIDHGAGLFTCHNHLSRSRVHEGDEVARGQAIGLSGASGMEFVLLFPWVAPHLHYDVWYLGEPVDPYALPDEVSLWRQRNDPVPWQGETVAEDRDYEPSRWDNDGVRAAIEACQDPELRAQLRALSPLPRRAAEVLFQRNICAPLFTSFPPLYRHPKTTERIPILDLPFQRDEVAGALLPGTGASPS